MTACPCVERTDKAGWHRYRGAPMCPDAIEHERAKGRANYAARRARVGQTVTPMTARSWVPGSPIEMPEVDPL